MSWWLLSTFFYTSTYILFELIVCLLFLCSWLFCIVCTCQVGKKYTHTNHWSFFFRLGNALITQRTSVLYIVLIFFSQFLNAKIVIQLYILCSRLIDWMCVCVWVWIEKSLQLVYWLCCGFACFSMEYEEMYSE